MKTHFGRLAATSAALACLAIAPAAHAEDAKALDSTKETQSYGDSGEQTYMAIKLENVQITSYQLGALDNDVAVEGITLTHEGFQRN